MGAVNPVPELTVAHSYGRFALRNDETFGQPRAGALQTRPVRFHSTSTSKIEAALRDQHRRWTELVAFLILGMELWVLVEFRTIPEQEECKHAAPGKRGQKWGAADPRLC